MPFLRVVFPFGSDVLQSIELATRRLGIGRRGNVAWSGFCREAGAAPVSGGKSGRW
jgi:hypothetical protein